MIFKHSLRNLAILLGFLLLVTSCQQLNIPDNYRILVDSALIKADSNAVELKRAIKEVPEKQSEGMAFLIAYMPENDLKNITADFLLENVAYAYRAREEFSWAKSIPDSIFLNDVLPYASLDEQRDKWRKDFYERFMPIVKNAGDVYEAIRILNDTINDIVGVEYSTKRKRACQGPDESIEQGLASCTGLSILLTDALRAVGIPSRIAGTPLWISKEGNHNWSEVWIDGVWYFTEYYPSGLNKGWFLERAGKTDPDNPIHGIYASSFKPAETYYPLVWKKESREIPAFNVTQRYIRLYQDELSAMSEKGGNTNQAIIGILLFDQSGNLESGNRVEALVEVQVDGKTLLKGRTAGPLKDMNDYLKIQLPKGQKFTLIYPDASGKKISREETARQGNYKITINQ